MDRRTLLRALAVGGPTVALSGGLWGAAAAPTQTGATGGASAVRFSSSGAITAAYRVLSDTNRNCAGSAMPWGTWLSCADVGRRSPPPVHQPQPCGFRTGTGDHGSRAPTPRPAAEPAGWAAAAAS